MGAPSKFTATRCQVLLDIFAETHSKARACAEAGITPKTLDNWLQLGAEAVKGSYFRFFQAYKKAESRHKQELLEKIKEIGARTDQWQAFAWMLERLYPEEFGAIRQIQTEVERQVNVMLDQLRDRLNPEEYSRVVAVLSGETGDEKPVRHDARA